MLIGTKTSDIGTLISIQQPLSYDKHKGNIENLPPLDSVLNKVVTVLFVIFEIVLAIVLICLTGAKIESFDELTKS